MHIDHELLNVIIENQFGKIAVLQVINLYVYCIIISYIIYPSTLL